MRLLIILGWIAITLSIAVAIGAPGYGIDHRGLGTAGDWIGIFVHKNSCAIVATYLLSVALFIPIRGSSARISRVTFVALALLLIAMTRSRTAWIGTAVLLIYTIVVRLLPKFERKSRRVVVVCGSAAVILAVVALAQNYAAIVYAIGKDPTMTGRTEIFRSVVVSAMKQPALGYGYWAFFNGLKGESANASLASGWVLPTVDNGYLGLWVELGAVGLVLFLFCSF